MGTHVLLRKAANVTLPEPLPRESKDLGINVSQACEKGREAAVSGARSAAWPHENRAAIKAMNEYVKKRGILLGEFRQF